MMKSLFSMLLLIGSVSSVYASIVPKSVGFDDRMQQVSYNANNTTVVHAKLGFLTTLRFDPEERVLMTRIGYEKGWDVSFDQNNVFVMPRPVVQQYESNGQSETELFEPNAKDWQTNLFVLTSKRHYSIELNSIDADEAPPAFVVNFAYPDDVAKQKDETKKQQIEEREKVQIAASLEAASAPKNWDYYMQVGKGSERIAPDFAYDNGVFTYIGFKNTKLFPSPFLYINGKEQIPNISSRERGKYRILIIHSLNDKFVLRYGDMVIGVTNKSFGKMIVNSGNTLSKQVERVDVENGK